MSVAGEPAFDGTGDDRPADRPAERPEGAREHDPAGDGAAGDADDWLADLADLGSGVDDDVDLSWTDLPRIEGYEALVEVARGGQGVVYRARRGPRIGAGASRDVAIKLLRTRPGEPGGSAGRRERRLLREVRIAAALDHPGIVPIVDHGRDARGRPYLVMPFVEGRTLDAVARDPMLGLDERLALLARVARAVAHAHRRGVIHRDLKPSNVIVDAGGRPTVLDFGLARIERDGPLAALARSQVSVTGEFVGSLAWAAPEQLEPSVEDDAPGAIDVRTDVHALGGLLHLLLTGRGPWSEARGARSLMAAIAGQSPPDPRRGAGASRGGRAGRSSPADDVLPGAAIPADAAAIVRRAMAKAPDDRYDSADALAADVDRVRAGEPVAERHLLLLRSTRRSLARARQAIAGAILVGLALGTLAMVAWTQADRAQSAEADARTQLEHAREQTRVAEASLGLLEGALLAADPQRARFAADAFPAVADGAPAASATSAAAGSRASAAVAEGEDAGGTPSEDVQPSADELARVLAAAEAGLDRPDLPPAARGRLALVLARAHWGRGAFGAADRLAARTIRATDAAAAAAQRHRDEGRALPPALVRGLWRRADALEMRGLVRHGAGDSEGAIPWLLDAAEAFDDLPNGRASAWHAEAAAAGAIGRSGDFERFRSILEDLLDDMRAAGVPQRFAPGAWHTAHRLLAEMAAHEGRHDAARRHVDAALDALARRGRLRSQSAAHLLRVRTLVELAAGENEAALASARTCREGFRATLGDAAEDHAIAVLARAMEAHALHRLGRAEEARAVAADVAARLPRVDPAAAGVAEEIAAWIAFAAAVPGDGIDAAPE